MINKAVKWADHVTGEAADANRIHKIVKFVRRQQTVLSLFGGKRKLDKLMHDLTNEAQNVQLALRDAHSLVSTIQSTMSDTLTYVEI